MEEFITPGKIYSKTNKCYKTVPVLHRLEDTLRFLPFFFVGDDGN
jgi:hypothetical protein